MLDPAVVALVQRLDRSPDDPGALEAVWNALVARGELQTLAVLAEKVAARREGRSAADLFARAGDLWMEQLRQPHKAKAAWAKALGVLPGHAWASRSRARCDGLTKAEECADENDPKGQESALRAVLALEGLTGPSATEPRRALARLLVARAKSAESDPQREAAKREAASLLGAIAAEGGTDRAEDTARAALQLWEGEPRAFSVLERAERDAGRVAELVMLRAVFLTANPAHEWVPRVRRELGDNYVSLGRVDEAIALLEPHLDEDPEVAARLSRWYERAGRADKVAALLAKKPLPEDPAARVRELRARMAALPATEREARAALCVQILEVNPCDIEALGALEQAAYDAGVGREGVPAYQRFCDALLRAGLYAGDGAGSTEQRTDWLERAARTAEAPLGDARRVCDAYFALRAGPFLSPERARAIEDALLRWLPRAERFDALLALLEARVATAAEHGAPALRDAQVAWAKARAKHAPEPALEVSRLRGFCDAHPGDAELEALYLDACKRAGDSQGVLAVLRARAEASQESASAARAYTALATELERTGDVTAALSAWQSARTRDPSSREPREAELRLLESQSRHAELLDALLSYANHPVAAGDLAGVLLLRAARVARAQGERGRAVELAERAKRFGPLDAELDALLSEVAEEREREARKAREASAGPAIGWITPVEKIPTEPPPPIATPAALATTDASAASPTATATATSGGDAPRAGDAAHGAADNAALALHDDERTTDPPPAAASGPGAPAEGGAPPFDDDDDDDEELTDPFYRGEHADAAIEALLAKTREAPVELRAPVVPPAPRVPSFEHDPSDTELEGDEAAARAQGVLASAAHDAAAAVPAPRVERVEHGEHGDVGVEHEGAITDAPPPPDGVVARHDALEPIESHPETLRPDAPAPVAWAAARVVETIAADEVPADELLDVELDADDREDTPPTVPRVSTPVPPPPVAAPATAAAATPARIEARRSNPPPVPARAKPVSNPPAPPAHAVPVASVPPSFASARPTLVGPGLQGLVLPSLDAMTPRVAERELPSIVIDPDFLEEANAEQAARDAALVASVSTSRPGPSAPPSLPSAPSPFASLGPGAQVVTAAPLPPAPAPPPASNPALAPVAPAPAPRTGSGSFALPNAERPAWMTPVAMPTSPFAKLSGAFAPVRTPATSGPPSSPAPARYQRIMATQYLDAVARARRG